MPIIFVHGVASRMYNGHEETWKEIEKNLRQYVAPVISVSGRKEDVLIEEAYWGNLSVPFENQKRMSLPDDQRVQKMLKMKGSWIKRKIKEFKHTPNKNEFLKDLLPEAREKLIDLPGYFFGRIVDPLRQPLNQSVTLFLGDVFFYLARRGTAENPGAITNQLLQRLSKARADQLQKQGEPLIVFSHSMGGQLVYDMVSHFLPQLSKTPKHENLKDLKVDFWCAAASQVGLFKEMKVFKQDDTTRPDSSPQEIIGCGLGVGVWDVENYSSATADNKIEPQAFPSEHLKIWWNLWDDSDYLSFTAQPLVRDVFDDMYDSGKAAAWSHTSHFDDPDFYKEFALLIQEAKDVDWDRKKFLAKVMDESPME